MFFRLTPHHTYEQRVVSVPGGGLAYGLWEPRDVAAAPTVLAVHGLSGNHRCWSYVVDLLRSCRVIAPDLRGRGASSSITQMYGMARHADDLAAVLDDVGVEQALTLGHSMGGHVGVVLADRHPDRTVGLVMVDGGLPMTRSPGPRNTRQAISPLIARIATVYPSVAPAMRFWRTHPAFVNSWTPVVEDYARYDLGGTPTRLRSRTTYAAVQHDSVDIAEGPVLAGALERLDEPFTMLTASHGLFNEEPGLYPPPVLLRWRERYPQGTIYPVHGTNHYTIIMERRGAEHVADAVRARLGHTIEATDAGHARHGSRHARPRARAALTPRS